MFWIQARQSWQQVYELHERDPQTANNNNEREDLLEPVGIGIFPKKMKEEQHHHQRRSEACQQQVKKYQCQFPDVPTMTSEQLVEKMKIAAIITSADSAHVRNNNNNNNCSSSIILVDVRTRQEQAVSMIPGAIPLQDFSMPRSQTNNNNIEEDPNHPSRVMVVLYCTVGYRSGLEGRRLQQEYPPWKGRIYNLDGILAYSFVEGAPPLVTTTTTDDDEQHHSNNNTKPQQQQQQPTMKIHTYGPTWEHCANPDYETVWFPINESIKNLQLVKNMCQCVYSYSYYYCCCCCCCSSFMSRIGQWYTSSMCRNKNKRVEGR
jgi:rhodanese-related sulfurtransferase